MASRLPKARKTSRSRSERAELAEWLANSESKTKLGTKLKSLSKQGLDEGEPLLDTDGVIKELGRRGYDE